jgi:hypothetical protein
MNEHDRDKKIAAMNIIQRTGVMLAMFLLFVGVFLHNPM